MYFTDSRGFVGFCNYYRRCIKDQITLTPLNMLLCKDVKLVWTSTQTKAFIEHKAALTDAPIPAHPRNDCEYILDTNASALVLVVCCRRCKPDDHNDTGGEDRGKNLPPLI